MKTVEKTKKLLWLVVLFGIVGAGILFVSPGMRPSFPKLAGATATPTETPTQTETPTPVFTSTPTPTATPIPTATPTNVVGGYLVKNAIVLRWVKKYPQFDWASHDKDGDGVNDPDALSLAQIADIYVTAMQESELDFDNVLAEVPSFKAVPMNPFNIFRASFKLEQQPVSEETMEKYEKPIVYDLHDFQQILNRYARALNEKPIQLYGRDPDSPFYNYGVVSDPEERIKAQEEVTEVAAHITAEAFAAAPEREVPLDDLSFERQMEALLPSEFYSALFYPRFELIGSGTDQRPILRVMPSLLRDIANFRVVALKPNVFGNEYIIGKDEQGKNIVVDLYHYRKPGFENAAVRDDDIPNTTPSAVMPGDIVEFAQWADDVYDYARAHPKVVPANADEWFNDMIVPGMATMQGGRWALVTRLTDIDNPDNLEKGSQIENIVLPDATRLVPQADPWDDLKEILYEPVDPILCKDRSCKNAYDYGVWDKIEDRTKSVEMIKNWIGMVSQLSPEEKNLLAAYGTAMHAMMEDPWRPNPAIFQIVLERMGYPTDLVLYKAPEKTKEAIWFANGARRYDGGTVRRSTQFHFDEIPLAFPDFIIYDKQGNSLLLPVWDANGKPLPELFYKRTLTQEGYRVLELVEKR